MFRTKREYRKIAKAIGLKKSKRYAAKMYDKQFEKFLPHGLVGKFEKALRAGNGAAA